MKAGLVGPSYQARSLPFNAQRCVNLFPVMDESQQGKEVASLYGTPGLSAFIDSIGDGPIRGEFASANGRAFVVSGQDLYEVFADGTSLLLHYLNTTAGACTIVENATQMAVCDGRYVYILTYADNTVLRATLPFGDNAGTVTFQDQYFIVNREGTGEFYISPLADGLGTWSALEFATAESSPDALVRVYSAYGQLFLLGELTTEAWYNTGGLDFPFARVEGAKMQTGCAAPHSVVDMDNSLFWLGQDDDGRGIVYRTQGYTPQRISTHAIELKIREAINISAFRAYSYQEDGHLFYVITGGGIDSTLVYDVATGLWHERAYLRDNGEYAAHRAINHMFVFGKHLVGDRENGIIYEQSLELYDDNGREIKRQRTFSHLNQENKRFRISELQIDFESGVGLTSGQGSNPIASLETSNDGGRTWSSENFASIGRKGLNKVRAVWRRLGLYDLFTARVTISDPVKVIITGAYIK